MDEAKDVVAQRHTTHGDFNDNATISQMLKEAMRASMGWDRLNHCQREALDMIVHKIARILAGDPNYADHWLDIEGYARITRERLPK